MPECTHTIFEPGYWEEILDIDGYFESSFYIKGYNRPTIEHISLNRNKCTQCGEIVKY